MKIAITLQKRGKFNCKKIISTYETIGQALDALATLAIGDEKNYTIGTPRYISPQSIYRIQKVNSIDIKRGWTTRKLLITDVEQEYTNDADFSCPKMSIKELRQQFLNNEGAMAHYWNWLIRQKDKLALRKFSEKINNLIQEMETAVERNGDKESSK